MSKKLLRVENERLIGVIDFLREPPCPVCVQSRTLKQRHNGKDCYRSVRISEGVYKTGCPKSVLERCIRYVDILEKLDDIHEEILEELEKLEQKNKKRTEDNKRST